MRVKICATVTIQAEWDMDIPAETAMQELQKAVEGDATRRVQDVLKGSFITAAQLKELSYFSLGATVSKIIDIEGTVDPTVSQIEEAVRTANSGFIAPGVGEKVR